MLSEANRGSMHAAGRVLFGRGEMDLTESMFGNVFSSGENKATGDGGGGDWGFRDEDDVEVVARAENLKQLLAMP